MVGSIRVLPCSNGFHPCGFGVVNSRVPDEGSGAAEIYQPTAIQFAMMAPVRYIRTAE